MLSLALACTLIAMCLHFYLARQHYFLRYGASTGTSVCNINGTFNCDAVAASTYSTFLTIPLAVWGLITNGILALLIFISRNEWTEEPELTGQATLWLAAIVGVASVVMGGISLGLMKAYCLFCLSAYLLSFLTLYFVWRGVSGYDGKFSFDLRAILTRHRWLAGMFVAVPLLSWAGHAVAEKNMGIKDVDRLVHEALNRWQAQPLRNFDENRGLILQTSDAKPVMTIVEFADFLCPHCRHAYPTLHAFASAHPDVKLVFKFFPLEAACNPPPGQSPQNVVGPKCQMAYIVQCSEGMGKKGWDAHHYFFDHQEDFYNATTSDEVTQRFATDMNVDAKALKECTESNATRDAIRAQALEGVSAEIEGTPAIFVNGRLLSGGQTIPVLEGVYGSLKK